MKRLLAVALCIPILSFALDVPKEWIEAYEQGRRDERERIIQELGQAREVLLAVLKFKRMLLGGLIPPPIAVDTYEIDRTTGVMEVRRTTKIINPSMVDFSALARLKVDLTKGVSLRSGYWVYVDAKDLSDYEVGWVKSKLRKLGYSPFLWKNVLVVSIEEKKATAQALARRVKEEVGVDAHVEKVILSAEEK